MRRRRASTTVKATAKARDFIIMLVLRKVSFVLDAPKKAQRHGRGKGEEQRNYDEDHSPDTQSEMAKANRKSQRTIAAVRNIKPLRNSAKQRQTVRICDNRGGLSSDLGDCR